MQADSPAPGAAPAHPVHAALEDVAARLALARPVELTILMPCLNEAETLAACLGKACGFIERTGIAGEIVIADNGSDDGSQAIARAHGARVVAVPVRGYGAALLAGIRAARGRFVIMGDSDDSYDFASLDAFVEKLREGDDIVMGNRFRGGIARAAMPKLHRYLGNPVLSFLGRLFFRSPVGDFHCGLRGFSRDAVLGLNLSSPGMEFASEMVVKATLADMRMSEVPTTLSPDGRSRPPHLRSWRDGWRHLKLLLEFAPHWLFLYPGGALAAMGVLVAAALVPGPLDLGRVTLDTATLLMGIAAIMVGVQLVLFYAIAKTAAVTAGLLRPSPRFLAMQPFLSVDRFCLAGGALFGTGVLIAALAVGIWSAAGFGDLDPATNIRLAAFATLAMALGVQSATAGFLVGLVRTRRVESAVPVDDAAADASGDAASDGSDREDVAA